MIEGVKAKQLQAVITFVDFKKAFDSIHRGKLMEILSDYGVQKKILDGISILYKDTVTQVITPDGETDFFEITAGVLLGETLAPYLFVVALDSALREATKDTLTGFMLEKRQGSRKPAVYITDADFADDQALISNYVELAQVLLSRLEIAAETIGLHANCKKMELMLFNQDETDLKTVSGDLLKQVHDFKHLGSCIEDSKKDMEVRIELA